MTTPSKCVWIAEDDEDLRELLAFMLRRIGLEVVEFGSGRELLDASQAGPLPDLLVTDHHMPEVNGLEAVQVLRSGGAELPVVLVTAFAEAAVKSRAEALDVLVVEKPCDLYVLRRTIIEQLS